MDMKYSLFIISLLFIIYFSSTSCVSNNEENLYGDNCDTLNMTYAKVKFIFEDNCYSCHTVPQGNLNIKLNSYSDVKAAVRTNRLVNAIHQTGTIKMPQGQPKLDDCLIDKIEAWINAGMPE